MRPPSATPASPGDPEDLLARFDDALGPEEVDLELCVVGGAVIRLAFRSDPGTRRPRALFAPRDEALASIRRAAERGRIALDRLEDAARELTTTGADRTLAVYEGRSLRVLGAPPDYVVAMKCLALAFAPEPGIEDDIRYLLRFLGVRSREAVTGLIDRYLNPRQRPADLEERLAKMLG